jgi:hypothetical protein
VDNVRTYVRSFDEFLETRFPEARYEAYHLMAIHEQLSRIHKVELQQVGWTKAKELAKVGGAEEALAIMPDIMRKLKLTVNETKTRVCKLPDEKFDFLGYTFGRCYSPRTACAYLGTVPSKKRVLRICVTISEEAGRDHILLDQERVVAKLNRMMIGWANYFCLGPVSTAYRGVDSHACKGLRRWLCAKHKVLGSGAKRFPEGSLHKQFGLVCLTKRTSNFPWATS